MEGRGPWLLLMPAAVSGRGLEVWAGVGEALGVGGSRPAPKWFFLCWFSRPSVQKLGNLEGTKALLKGLLAGGAHPSCH